MRRALTLWWVVQVATALVVAGCGGAVETPAPPLPRALTWEQELRVSDAMQHLVRQCMNRHGFQYWEDLVLTRRESRPVGFVHDDLEWARTYGYGSRIDAKYDRVRSRNPNGTYRSALSEARRTAFDAALDGGENARMLTASRPGGGTVRKRLGGCTETAERTLYDDPVAWFRARKVAEGLPALYGADLMKDRELREVIAAWSACMSAAGHPYADPQAAHDAARAQPGGFEAERKTAVADATCARSTNLRAVASAREAHYQDALRSEYGKEVDRYRTLAQRAFARAKRIVPTR